jgi:phosphomethylpyrimidine synthase
VNLEKTIEFKKGLFNETRMKEIFDTSNAVSYIHHPNQPVIVGERFLLKVNTNIGISNISDFSSELIKLEKLVSLPYAPDTLMDHTALEMDEPLWLHMVKIANRPIGTVPVYSIFNAEYGIDKNKLLERIEEMASGGVNFMGFHFTATPNLYEIAKRTRKIPTTSWGGSVVLKDSEINNRQTNILDECFEDILKIAKKHKITLSIASAFRPARIDEALDEVHIQETILQRKYIDVALENGVQTIMEGIGHISINRIPEYCELIRANKVPLMPLGAMITDATIGFDHVTAAVGATLMAMQGNIGMINSVTREEHTGGVPSLESVHEALQSAKAVAHMINLERFEAIRDIDKKISDNRAEKRTCAVNGGIFDLNPNPQQIKGCIRCNKACPFILLN